MKIQRTRHLVGSLVIVLILVSAVSSIVQAQTPDLPPPQTVTIAGTLQPQLGCSGEWNTTCEQTMLTYDPDNDIWTATWFLMAGSYEYKAALNGTWDDNFGLLGEYYGPNIPLEVPEDMEVTFTYDHKNHLVTDSINNHVLEVVPGGGSGAPAPVTQPDFVTIPGTIQSVLGCPGDWAPDCDVTFLTFDEEDNIWQGEFVLPAGDYEYKVAINQSWDENYGGLADPGGPNVALSVAEDNTAVRFYYDHATHWVADSINSTIAVVTGTFQDEAGCENDNDPTCLRGWLQDPDGDGTYTANVAAEPGDYEAVVAIDESLDLSYGVDGAEGGDPYTFTVPEDAASIFFSFDTGTNVLTISTAGPPKGDIAVRSAYWVARDTIAWNVDTDSAENYSLFYDLDGRLSLGSEGVTGANEIALTLDENGLDSAITDKFPQLTGFAALKIGEDDLSQVRIALKGQIAVAATTADGTAVDAAGLQIPGVLDDVYPYDGPLGVTFDESGVPTFTVWAPTARSAHLLLFNDADPESEPESITMPPDPNTGTWHVTGEADWYGRFYLYDIEVYVPTEGGVVHNQVTDPYSVSLSTNSTRSQVIDLTDPTYMPDGWDGLTKPELDAFTDIVLYELHIRDFSAIDETVPEELRGTFAAFTVSDSAGMAHLKAMADAGLTHVHLLPAFDIATIEEDKSLWETADRSDLLALAPDSEEQQALLDPYWDTDGYNWGYDPYHYDVPEGSYSTDPNGPQRILEFREMVQALNNAGLRVVMDVVYNHTSASGQADKSVLDKIVPGYYYRLLPDGRVANSTCCANTATENDMMRKLMVDSVVMWAKQYKVDGFRFDLMGHHMVKDMQAVRDALDSLTMEKDGVDGSKIYVYGEGWDFGEVANNARGENATQLNVGGLHIGTFNDRIRDAVRGGSPFGGYQEQGFATGLYYDTNDVDTRSEDQQLQTVLHFSDLIRVALAGNLADYRFMDSTGLEVAGSEVDYNGAPAGYTTSPDEHIIYISAHDNETWFDAVQAKVPTSLSMEDRVKVQNMGLSLVMFSQGVPFFHAGSDMLRSKSFDRDSYNSGDWYNAIDWTFHDNNWGHGLPPADKNQDNWDIMQPLLGNLALTPDMSDIRTNSDYFQMLLRIRQSSPLFRLQTAEDVENRLVFHNTGPDQTPGLIVMSISDVDQAANLDPNADMVLVLFNATPDTISYTLPKELSNVEFGLHPEQALLSDSTLRGEVLNGVAQLPPRTTTVLIALEGSISTSEETTEPNAEEDTGETAEQPAATAEPGVQPTAEPGAEPESSGSSAGTAVAIGIAGIAGAAAAGYWLYRRRQI
ncbi:MAG: pullulanase-type alpha-1,6-glucosidase [Candidatus Promineifilaceae bacterium]